MGGGGRVPPQGSESGAQDLGSLIRDLQQRYGNEGSGGAGSARHNSSLIPSSVIMSAQGRDALIRPAAPGGIEGGGGDEAWADEVIMYRGFPA